MTNQKSGKYSFRLNRPPVISCWASAVGKKEALGPLSAYFDLHCKDPYWGQKAWEQGEQKIQENVLEILAKKADCPPNALGPVLSGDLLNQCIGSSFALKNRCIPHLGLYGACSTMAEALLLGSMLIGGGFFEQAVAMTSSHFPSAERQYRFPLNYGGQRPPTSQWTVTGAGAAWLTTCGKGPVITACTAGCVIDQGITDANHMGAAMAPAALDTLLHHFQDLKLTPDDYDMIVTGDLGLYGTQLLQQLCADSGIPLANKLTDCGNLIYDRSSQDVHSGGSGCGCSAVTLCGYLLDQLNTGRLKRILFCGTGALLSPLTVQQKMSIPAICHCVRIEGVNL